MLLDRNWCTKISRKLHALKYSHYKKLVKRNCIRVVKHWREYNDFLIHLELVSCVKVASTCFEHPFLTRRIYKFHHYSFQLCISSSIAFPSISAVYLSLYLASQTTWAGQILRKAKTLNLNIMPYIKKLLIRSSFHSFYRYPLEQTFYLPHNSINKFLLLRVCRHSRHFLFFVFFIFFVCGSLLPKHYVITFARSSKRNHST